MVLFQKEVVVMAMNCVSNHFNLSRDYNQFRKQVLQLNPLNLNKGNKLKLPNTNKSHINSVAQESSLLKMQRKSSIQQQANLSRVVIQNGNKLEIYTRGAVQTQSQTQMRSELQAHSTQLVQGNVNGKKVYLNAEKDVKQVVTDNRSSATTRNQDVTENITRDTQKNGNVTHNTTKWDTTSQGDYSANTQVDRKTETEVLYRTYDDKGNLTKSQYSNQAVTIDQETNVTQNWQGTGDRTIDQTITVNTEKAGNKTIRDTTYETLDIATGNKVYNTTTQTDTSNLVERFDPEGNLIGASTSSQQATTDETRNIDSNRTTASNQNTRTVTGAGETETVTKSQYATNAVTVDKTEADTLVQSYNAAGALTERTSERETLSTTTENLAGESIIRSASTVKNGSNVATTEIKAKTKSDVETEIVYNQDGNLTKRSIETETAGTTYAAIENRMNPNGQRIIDLNSEQTGTRETKDLTIGANNQGRLVETATQSLQAVDGKMHFNPATGEVGPAAPGAIVIDLGANTGIRTSFKLDNGSLKFDFTAIRMTATEQSTTTGKVAPGMDGLTVNGTETSQVTGVAEEIRFKGEIISSVDAEGNRVIELKASVVDQGIGARLVDNFKGFQMEDGKAEIDINGKLTVKRETVVEGNKTTYKSTSQAEMELNKVEEIEDMGVNVKTLTPLNVTDGFKAGLVADHNALRFNFGLFNLGISFVG
jgi:hypothetical protein